MRCKLKRAGRMLRGQNGSAYVETLIQVMMILMLFYLFLSLIAVGADYAKLVVYANAQADVAIQSGAVPAVDNAVIKQNGLSPDDLSCSWDARYFDASTSRLAFRQPFRLTVTYRFRLSLLFIRSGLSVPLPLRYVASGTSGVYWK